MKLTKLFIFILMQFFAVLGYSQAVDSIFHIKTEGVLDYNNPKRYLLKNVDVIGAQAVNVNMMLNSLGLNKGDSIYLPSEEISNIERKLWQVKLYSDIKVNVRTADEDAYLEIILKGRPFVSNWDILGVSNSHKSDLLETLNLARNIQYSDYLVESSAKAIKEYYTDKGFYNTTVNFAISDDSVVYKNNTYVNVSFIVDKKDKVKVKKISFDGVEGIKSKSIAAAMKNNKAGGLLNILKSKKFRPKKLDEDISSIEEYLQSLGYRNAVVVTDSIKFIEDSRIELNFDIYQGNKFYYGDITWTGNEKYPEDYLEQILGVSKGEVYDNKNLKTRLGLTPEAFQKNIPNVKGLYQDDGYLTSDVIPIETEKAQDTVDIDVRIYEGKQFRINEINIAGNVRTHDKVARRDLFIRPGELYSQSLLINSIQKLGALGNFSQESTTPNITPVSDQLVDISFNLEEASTDAFNFSGGFGAGTLVLGIGITFKNLSLRKMFNKGAWRPYPSGDNQALNLQVQSNGTYYKNISFTFLEPWLGGNKPNSLSTSFYYSTQTNGVTVFDAGDARFATMGAAVRFGTRLNWPDPYFTFTAGLTYQHYNLTNWTNFVMNNGISHILALDVMLQRNSVNSPLYPSAGSDFNIKLSATPPYSLFKQDGYYANEALTPQQRYKLIEYFKVELGAKIYEPLFGGNKFVFYAGANFGYLGNYSKDLKSPFEGYSVGGAGVGGYNIYGINYVSLRGYKDGALTPMADYGEQAKIYSKYTMELRYPFVNTPGTTMYGVLFAEAGNAYYSWQEFKPFDLKKSLGIGLRIFLPIVGMFGIDFGYGFDRVPGELEPSGFQFHFNMGQQF